MRVVVLAFFSFLPQHWKKIAYQMKLQISNKPLRQDFHVKYLTLIIDSHLTWKKHIHELSKKVSRGAGILSKLRHFVTKEILLQLYYSLVYPFLTYGLLIWGNTYDTSLNTIITRAAWRLRVIKCGSMFIIIIIIIRRQRRTFHWFAAPS